jgi:hypothetical protein
MAFPRSVQAPPDFVYLNASVVNSTPSEASGTIGFLDTSHFTLPVLQGMSYPRVGWRIILFAPDGTEVDVTPTLVQAIIPTAVPVWSALVQYPTGSVVQTGFLGYIAIAPSLGQNPAVSPLFWQRYNPPYPGPPYPILVTITMSQPAPGLVAGSYAYVAAAGQVPLPFAYVENRNQDIVAVADDYVVSCESFRLPINLIPLFTAPVGSGRYLGTLILATPADGQFPDQVVALPDNAAFTPPAVYEYDTVVRAVNAAFSLAFTNAEAAGAALGQGPPQIVLNSVTGLFSLYAPQGVYQPDDPAGTEIYFTGDLYNLFNSLPGLLNGDTELANNVGMYKLLVENQGTNSFFAVNPQTANNMGLVPGPYWQMTQETSSLAIIDQFESIVITTALPTVQENLPGANDTNGLGLTLDPSLFSIPGNTNLRPVLLDIAIPRQASGQRVPSPFVFNANGENQARRFVSLGSKEPIRNLSTYAYAQDRQFNLFPILISPNDFGSVKSQLRSKRSLSIYMPEQPPVNVRRVPPGSY